MNTSTYRWPFERARLTWIGGPGGWPTLYGVDLSSLLVRTSVGVYVIWSSGPNPSAVRVGQGAIAHRLATHRSNSAIRRQDTLAGPLYVSWALVTPDALDGVERYLGLMLRPKVGRAFPIAQPVAVNFPWETRSAV
jgi:hypothetical protein